MNKPTERTFLIVAVLAACGLAVGKFGHRAALAVDAVRPEAAATQIEQLQRELKRVESLAPDQAAVMTHVGYHFSNLWFAVEQENWPLADFYLGETRNNIAWAVRTKPMRKTAAGDIDLGAIAQALDNTQLAQMKQAIAAKRKDDFVRFYDQMLEGCYSCHKASEKPYLRPQRPTRPEVPIINFDPHATVPN